MGLLPLGRTLCGRASLQKKRLGGRGSLLQLRRSLSCSLHRLIVGDSTRVEEGLSVAMGAQAFCGQREPYILPVRPYPSGYSQG